ISLHLGSVFASSRSPCAPYFPELLISVCTLELFHMSYLHYPWLSLQAFLQILCDLNNIPYQSYMHWQFTVCYDLYISILQQNACLACTFVLHGESGKLVHPHYCIDGNNSLKRLHTPEADPSVPSQGRVDDHDGSEDYFIPREEVNSWSKDAIGDMVVTVSHPQYMDGNSCTNQWANMKNDMHSSMWGVFDETGIFVSLCRHGFMLLATDMVQSRELAKYPLAIENHVIKRLGPDLTCAYDIEC
ncbi:hypothetical protein EV421DRAFT_1974032, partial [Armillaria borealis]